jgi:hypothetical protein
MCTYSFRVERYKAGLEDGFDIIKSRRTTNICYLVVPYVYNEDGNKEYIHRDDLIFLKNNIKQVVHNEIIEKNRNRKTKHYV